MAEQAATRELWDKYMLDRTAELKNELLMRYIPLVRTTVMRMMPTYYAHNDYDDLISCGVMGLMSAIDRFDPSREIKFESFATKRIKGSILDHMRKQDWAPSSYRRKINRVSEAYRDLEASLARTPSEQEVAQRLEMSVSDLQKVLETTHTFNIMYFEDIVSESSSIDELSLSDDASPSEQLEQQELISTLGKLIDELSEKERTVVSLYYYEELTLKEIAQVLGVSESRVSQIHSKILIKLKGKLQKEFPI